MLKAIDLFCGFGGLALGAAEAGIHQIFGIDNDGQAIDAFLSNRHSFANVGTTIGGFKANILESFDFFNENRDTDLVLGGPPCQPFSASGRMHGQHDSRDGLGSFVEAISIVRPKCFVVENVFGLGFQKHRRYLNTILRGLKFPHLLERRGDGRGNQLKFPTVRECKVNSALYNVSMGVLNAADFGAAQHRRRLFIVGLRRDVSAEKYKFPDPTHSIEMLLWEQFGSGSYWKSNGFRPAKYFRDWVSRRRIANFCYDHIEESKLKRWHTVRDIQCAADISDSWTKQRPGATPYGHHSGTPIDWPAKTIKAGVHGVPGGENIVQVAHNKYRYLTLRECASCQGFPDTYAADYSFSKNMRLIGNAVPVMLARAVVAALPLF